MEIIYINLILTILFTPFLLTKDKLIKKYLVIVLNIYFFCSLALQNGSPDFDGYKYIYYGTETRLIEPLYAFFCYLFNTICEFPFRFFWIVQAIIVCILFNSVNKFYAENELFSCLLFMNLYFPLKQLIQIRNLISILLFLVAGKYYINKKRAGCGINYLMASTVHFSGFLSIITFKDTVRRNKIYFVFFLVSIIFTFVPFSKIFSPLIEPLTHLNSGLAYYFGWFCREDFMGRTLFHITRIIALVLFAKYCFPSFDMKTRYLYRLYILGAFIRFFFSSVGMLGLRFSEVFMFAEIYLYPNIINKMKTKYKPIFYLLFIFYSVLMIISFVKNNSAFIEYFCFV